MVPSGNYGDLAILWITLLPGLLDFCSLGRLWPASPELAKLGESPEVGDSLRARLQTLLRGSSGQLQAAARALETLRCRFLLADATQAPGLWDGAVSDLDLHAVGNCRKRFPEALLFLWQTSFAPDALAMLDRPLANVESLPSARLRIGAVELTVRLNLFAVSESFFDAARPHKRLLLKLGLEVQRSTAGVAGSRPEDFEQICGEGHRWAIVCRHAEKDATLPMFCSLRECFLRPAWRIPSVLVQKERPLQHRCQEINGEEVSPDTLASPLRLLLAIYRVDDDEGPDEPNAGEA
ncbi:unnamed protein product [Symbiodinium natans]|uniref:Uncharacterized protein n=1 Tax=Symbiodinium natans TaxID=878477 RepID=A0A812L5K9_9DINO|nr:unnamed protein product [Symbiodinium natans]